MNFSNNLKITYWLILLIGLSVILLMRFNEIVSGKSVAFDNYIFAFWFGLIIFPLVKEFKMAGFSFKKDIEKMKEEIRGYILELKSEIRNDIHFQPNIYLDARQAKKEEYEAKLNDEVKEYKVTFKEGGEDCINANGEDKETKKQERFKRIILTEKLVSQMMKKRYGDDYSEQIKIENNFGKEIIVDGVVFNGEKKIKEIIEIKLISSEKSFESFRYIAGRFITKLYKLGIKSPIRLVVVSEKITNELAKKIKDDLNYILSLKPLLNNDTPRFSLEFYKIENESLLEIKPK